MKKYFVLALIIIFVSCILPNSIQSKNSSKYSPIESRTSIGENDNQLSPYVNAMINSGIFSLDETVDLTQEINAGEFIKWIMQAINIPHCKTLESESSPTESIDLYIDSAIEKGYLIKSEIENPESSITRAQASIFLLRFLDKEAQDLASSYTQPVIPAQDGFYGIPEEAIGSLSVCYHPQYQLMEYRTKMMDDFRYVEPNEPMLKGEALYSMCMLMNPPKKGGSLNIALPGEPKTLFSGLGYMSSDTMVMNTLYSSGIDNYDANWKQFPVLLKRQPTQENGLWKVNYKEDGTFNNMEITFELREDMKWSDNTPITADDCVFSYYLYNHPEFPVIHSELDYWIDSFEAIDNHTVKVVWNHFWLYVNSSISFMPRHYFEDQFNYHLEPYNLNDESYLESEKYEEDTTFIHNCYTSDYADNPVHAGPYKVKEWIKGEKLELEANENFVLGHPVLDTIQFDLYCFNDNLPKKCENEEIDMAFNLYFSIAEELENNEKYQVAYTPSLVWEHIDLNTDNEVLEDVQVRQALLHAINREEIVKEAWNGKAEISHSWLGKKHPAYNNETVHKYPYNPEKAAQLLDEAGWIQEDENSYREKDGEILTITFQTTAQNKTRAEVQELITQNWEDIGVLVDIDNEQAIQFFTSTLRERRFDGPTGCMYAWVMSPSSNLYSIVNSSQIPSEENGFSGQNYTAFSNKEVDTLTSEILELEDKTKTYKNLRRVQEILTEELPSLPLLNRCDISVYRKNLMNFQPTGTSSSPLWNIAYMYWGS